MLLLPPGELYRLLGASSFFFQVRDIGSCEPFVSFSYKVAYIVSILAIIKMFIWLMVTHICGIFRNHWCQLHYHWTFFLYISDSFSCVCRVIYPCICIWLNWNFIYQCLFLTLFEIRYHMEVLYNRYCFY